MQCAVNCGGRADRAAAKIGTAYTGLGERLTLIPIELWFVVSGLLLWRSAGNRWEAP